MDFTKYFKENFFSQLIQRDKNINSLPIVSQRLKLLRKAYDLTSIELGALTNISYRNIQNYEGNKAEPALYKLLSISKFTAVSIDWLIGSIETPYYKEFIESLESQIWKYDDSGAPYVSLTFSLPEEDNQQEVTIYPFPKLEIVEEYANKEKRERFYSLSDRANIIFLLHKYIKLITDENPFFLSVDGKITFSYAAYFASDPIMKLHYFGLGVPLLLWGKVEREQIIKNLAKPIYDLEETILLSKHKNKNA